MHNVLTLQFKCIGSISTTRCSLEYCLSVRVVGFWTLYLGSNLCDCNAVECCCESWNLHSSLLRLTPLVTTLWRHAPPDSTDLSKATLVCEYMYRQQILRKFDQVTPRTGNNLSLMLEKTLLSSTKPPADHWHQTTVKLKVPKIY